jgi:hypothetical protein
MGYYEYRFLPDPEREQLFQAWCQRNSRDPEQDGSADDFIASLDSRFAEGVTLSKAELIPVIRSINPDITGLDSRSKAEVLAIYNQLTSEAMREDTNPV